MDKAVETDPVLEKHQIWGGYIQSVPWTAKNSKNIWPTPDILSQNALLSPSVEDSD
jgi:hypothetical protein